MAFDTIIQQCECVFDFVATRAFGTSDANNKVLFGTSTLLCETQCCHGDLYHLQVRVCSLFLEMYCTVLFILDYHLMEDL